jgi:PKD repeat protein
MADLEAVLAVEDPEWLQPGKQPGVNARRGYAPFPVFAEGWKSTGAGLSYTWSFEAGQPDEHGMCAAHIYEVPGTYWIHLTVTDEAGQKDYATQEIEVLPRDGKKWAIEPGSDLTSVFAGMTEKRYGPGDEILIPRGYEYEIQAGAIKPSHWSTGYGYVFRGDPPEPLSGRPIIHLAGVKGGSVFDITGTGLGHVSFVDLDFRLSNGGNRVNFWRSTQRLNHLLFLRVELSHMAQGIVLTHAAATRQGSNIFVTDCLLMDSIGTQLFATVSRLAVQDSQLERSNNHLAYLSRLDKAVIAGNVFESPNRLRHALRISGVGGETYPTQHVVVRDNTFLGSKQDGRYTWLLVHIAPNKPEMQLIKDLLFAHNYVSDGEHLLNLGSCEDVQVRGNIFRSLHDRTATGARIVIGSQHGYDRRPCKNITVAENFVETSEQRRWTGGIYQVRQGEHDGIEIRDNVNVVYREETPPIVVARHVKNLVIGENLTLLREPGK